MKTLGQDIILYLVEFLESWVIVSLASTCTRLRAILKQSDRVCVRFCHLRCTGGTDSGPTHWPNASRLAYYNNVTRVASEQWTDNPWVNGTEHKPIQNLHAYMGWNLPLIDSSNVLMDNTRHSVRFLTVVGQWPWALDLSVQCANLEAVTLRFANVTQEVWSMLAALPKLRCLRLLECTRLGDFTIPAAFSHLEVLDLYYSGGFLPYFVPFMDQLQVLSLGTDAECWYFLELANAHKLRELRLYLLQLRPSPSTIRDWKRLAEHPSLQYVFIQYREHGNWTTHAEVYEVLKMKTLLKHTLCVESTILTHARCRTGPENTFAIALYHAPNVRDRRSSREPVLWESVLPIID